MLSILNIDRVKVKIAVPESEISQFATGQTLAVTVGALGNERFRASVTQKAVSADPLSRSYEVKAIIDNAHHRLLPGMVCEAFAARGTAGGVAIPAQVVQLAADNTTFVWEVVDGKACKTIIVLGDNAGNDVVVAGGLSRGDRIIVEGQQKVSQGMSVKE